MLINVNPTTGEVQKIGGEEEDKTLQIADRLKDELHDWLMYKNMHEQTHDSRYQTISQQEFMHGLVALSDLLDSIKPRLNAEENNEFLKFKTECLSK